jgi:hypothetical protein
LDLFLLSFTLRKHLENTLDKYIDYKKLNLARTKEKLPEVICLIITAVDVLTAVAITQIGYIFDYLHGLHFAA